MSSFDALGKKVLDLLSRGQPAGCGRRQRSDDSELRRPGARTENTHKNDVKADYNLDAKDIFSARWSYHRQDVT